MFILRYCKPLWQACPILADLSNPLDCLLKKDATCEWSSACQDNFTAIKQVLTSTKILTHYDSKLPIGLVCDASLVGIGAVIYHIYLNGTEKPIAYGSNTLSSAGHNYSQIERKGLSLIFGMKSSTTSFMVADFYF